MIMTIAKTILRVFVLCALLGLPGAHAAGNEPGGQGLGLSPDLAALLRAEMAELSGGLGQLAVAVPTGDWATVSAVADKMNGSYLMKQALTADQKAELQRVLPEHFRHLDADFHRRSEKLGAAAAAADAELVVYQLSRLIEACTVCHATFARHRFAGFKNTADGAHSH